MDTIVTRLESVTVSAIRVIYGNLRNYSVRMRQRERINAFEIQPPRSFALLHFETVWSLGGNFPMRFASRQDGRLMSDGSVGRYSYLLHPIFTDDFLVHIFHVFN